MRGRVDRVGWPNCGDGVAAEEQRPVPVRRAAAGKISCCPGEREVGHPAYKLPDKNEVPPIGDRAAPAAVANCLIQYKNRPKKDEWSLA